ncbi:RND family efflux transporter MFP subunit [Simplicispira metamorpha]|uniref:RND family efflux transporter MFP subunit n=2 Tax=Simplicispira metamorpha TaxID=80881 RepID=A0A4R2NGV0_9BURK|nr:RND family efflux transporter MFP subunit [Simplicispira metamorpha]
MLINQLIDYLTIHANNTRHALPPRKTVNTPLPVARACFERLPMFLLRPFAIALAVALPVSLAAAAAPAELAVVPAQAAASQGRAGFDGVVEAVRQTVVAAQVSGAVVELAVKAGDRVQAGQLLLRIDARTADQSAAASDAQVLAARAALEVATREYGRQQQLYQQKYISQAALERAESEFKATRAQVAAQVAQAGAARTQTGLHTVRAPYAGVVAEVPVQLGDMALPGRALLTLYDPSALRVTAAVPQSVAQSVWLGAASAAQATGVAGDSGKAGHSASSEVVRVELPGLPAAQQWPQPTRVQRLPTVDAATHTQQVRADLPAGLSGAAPGMFARLWLPVAGTGASAAGQRVTVPLQSIVRRAEMTGVYVQGEGGKPLLRQVRLGRVDGDRVEVLTGVAPGEQVIADPQAATRAQ